MNHEFRSWIALLSLIVSISKSQEVKAPVVGNLKNPHGEACACAWGYPGKNDSIAFIRGLTWRNCWININGIDTRLKLLKSDFPRPEDLMVGQKFSESYSSKYFKIEIEYAVTKPSHEEDSQLPKIAATLTVSHGKKKSTVRLEGNCSCK